MQKATKSTKITDVKRSWHIFDAKGQVLGRFAVGAAHALMGKAKPYFVKNLDCGDNVVIINAKHIVVTGHKEEEKLYGNYSGYPGGLKQKPLWKLRQEKPTEIIKRAILGMLPKNKLRDRLKTRLYIYPEAEHPYKDQLKAKV